MKLLLVATLIAGAATFTLPTPQVPLVNMGVYGDTQNAVYCQADEQCCYTSAEIARTFRAGEEHIGICCPQCHTDLVPVSCDDLDYWRQSVFWTCARIRCAGCAHPGALLLLLPLCTTRLSCSSDAPFAPRCTCASRAVPAPTCCALLLIYFKYKYTVYMRARNL